MKSNINPHNEILMLTSYPPRECGIATYSRDLFNALAQTIGDSSVSVCALESSKEKRDYPEEVKYILDTTEVHEYILLAERVNKDKNIKAVFIQHEFGLFGGRYGEMLLYFLYSLRKPVVITFHTVLPEPNQKLFSIVKSIIERANAVMVMTNDSANILANEYNIPESLIHVIPHGTHPVKQQDKSKLKEKYSLTGKITLSTFGLISSNKSIETALEALPAIVEKFHEVLYLIIGRTHPEVVKHEGEAYRLSLEKKITDLGLSNNVRFINRYVELPELLELLQLTDVYLFTSKDPKQAVSGTFAYAMSCGCPVISTAIPHAKEMLTSDTGILVGFNDPKGFSDAVLKLLDNPELHCAMSKNTLDTSRASEWSNVALSHRCMLQNYLLKHPLILNFPRAEITTYRTAN
jgi:glycosyltransferase involved in cell wall biosynthesis